MTPLATPPGGGGGGGGLHPLPAGCSGTNSRCARDGSQLGQLGGGGCLSALCPTLNLRVYHTAFYITGKRLP